MPVSPANSLCPSARQPLPSDRPPRSAAPACCQSGSARIVGAPSLVGNSSRTRASGRFSSRACSVPLTSDAPTTARQSQIIRSRQYRPKRSPSSLSVVQPREEREPEPVDRERGKLAGILLGGERGIRTPDAHERTDFTDRPLEPLGHLPNGTTASIAHMFYSVQSDRPTYRSVSEVHDARARRGASVARGSRHGATQVRRTTRSVFLSPGGRLLGHGLLTGTTLRRASMVTPRYPGQFTWSSLGSPLRTLEANARGSDAVSPRYGARHLVRPSASSVTAGLTTALGSCSRSLAERGGPCQDERGLRRLRCA